MSFVQLFGAVLTANLVTVWFVYCAYQIAKRDHEAPTWALLGFAACSLFAGLAAYINIV